jgi:predicted nucleic acid-binding protein
VAVTTFLDTSVLVSGLIDFGPQSAAAQTLLAEVAERKVAGPATAWHCCLEFFSVATRLPSEFRLSSADAAMLRGAAGDGIAGGRIYDTHIAEVARAAGAAVIVTDNRRHFLSALRYAIRVETPAEFLARAKQK